MTVCYVEHGLLKQLPDLIGQHIRAQKMGVVCDLTTQEVAGERIAQMLGANAELLCLGNRIKPTIDLADKLKRQAASCDLLISVGTGTITDLTRYVAHRLEIPFVAFATAPSMNGFVSPTASLLFGKHKSSVQAKPPLLFVADLDIMHEAPLRLIRAGLGDVLCRTSIESDLILAEQFSGSAYTPDDFIRLRELDEAIDEYQGEMHQREPELLRLLIEALIIGGMLMQKHGSSAPCSQSEHMIAHAYEMFYTGVERDALHGEAISVTTLTMARLQQKLIRRKPKLRSVTPNPEQFKRIFGSGSYESLLEAYKRKLLSAERCEELNDTMDSVWKEVIARMDERVIKALTLEKTLTKLGCPTDHRQLRWHRQRYEHAVTSAHMTRDRFTFLDIPAMDKTLRAEI